MHLIKLVPMYKSATDDATLLEVFCLITDAVTIPQLACIQLQLIFCMKNNVGPGILVLCSV